MATKFLLSKKLLANTTANALRSFSRTLLASPSPSSAASSAVSPLTFADKPEPFIQAPPPPAPVLDLDSPDKLFAALPTSKLLHAALTLQLTAVEPLVDLGMWVMNSRAMERDNLVRDAVLAAVKLSFFGHFCAGENVKEMERCVRRVNGCGLRAMLDFSVEFSDDNKGCDENMEGFMEAVKAAEALPPASVSTVVVKVTALCPLRLLERVSHLLRWQQKDPSFNLPWKHPSLPLFSPSSPLYHTLQRPEPLTPEEERDLQLAHQRLHKICQRCVEANVPLTIDAEHTAVQPAIDYFTYSSAILYNKHDNPIVYGTIQAYLKDSMERLLLASEAAGKMGVPMGFKLVRGAYMSSESKLASSLGYESPIHDSIQDTHACYNDCAAFMLERTANGSDGVILATHNVESGKLAAIKARELGIEKGNHKLEFAQLYGMADALSFGLRNAGFQVSKYMPYGPVDKVMPYLLRRAEENRGLLASSSIDRVLMRKELTRRLKHAVF